ncbi:pteridine reductase [Motiliproteus sp. SC1-56]|uniref:pteridine reductase n=1 Tax=Motiliproteus sp. SC1-56 TaxID=2799565 RepID=UPI001A8DBC0C
MTEPRVVLITGAARRIGAAIAERLHRRGYRVLIHYRGSRQAAESLSERLNSKRANSARTLQADLVDTTQVLQLAEAATDCWGRLDGLVNNASDFYPTPLGSASEEAWEQLLGSNLKAPFFLSQALAPALSEQQGAIVNIADVNSERGLPGFPIYSSAKAGLGGLTRALATELAPRVRVNAVAPGPILPPEGAAARDAEAEQATLGRTLLGRYGNPRDIAEAVAYLLEAGYVTGQILAVDGGKSIT